LLAGWFESKLRWTGEESPTVEESPSSDDLITAYLSGEGWELTAGMREESITVKYGGGRPPFTTAVPRETPPDAIVVELRKLGHDTVLRDTMLALAGRSR
jgi:hypothetical protein